MKSPNQSDPAEVLLNYFKVMGNADRIRIAARLMQSPATITELAAGFSLKRPTVLEHVAALRELNLVQPAADNAFAFDVAALHTLNQALARKAQPTPIDDYADEATRKTLRPFFDGMRLREIPEGQRRQVLLLNWLVTQFDTGVQYSERQVNEIIERYNADYATLRRGLIDAGLMQRDHGIYWRIV